MDEEEGDETPPTMDQLPRKEQLTNGPTVAALCVSSLVKFCFPHSMKVRNTVMPQEVVVLIDSGASHNFISNDFVLELSISRTPT